MSPIRVTTTWDVPTRPGMPSFSRASSSRVGRRGDSPTLSSVMAKASTILVSTSTRMLSRMKPRFTFQTCRIHSPRVDGIRPLPSMASLISRLPSTTLAVAGSLPGTIAIRFSLRQSVVKCGVFSLPSIFTAAPSHWR